MRVMTTAKCKVVLSLVNPLAINITMSGAAMMPKMVVASKLQNKTVAT